MRKVSMVDELINYYEKDLSHEKLVIEKNGQGI